MSSKKATKQEKPTETNVTITAPDIRTAVFKIKGLSPYVQNKFPAKAREQIKATQEAGSQAKSKRARAAKDFDEVYRGAQHIAEEGWHGIPAPAFRNAMIDACRLVGFKMTIAKCSLMIQADGFDVDDGTPLVKIDGKPERHESYVRNETGVVDLRHRPMWRRWTCDLKVQFDAGQFSATDVTNLLLRAGMQVGVGEGRPFSKKSAGQGWGCFTIES